MFRGEKNTQWEGGYRVPCVIKWPGVIKPGTLINDIGAHEDMMPTLLAAAGQPNVKEELLKGKTIGKQNFKVHLDGYNLIPYFKDGAEWPRKEFLYWTDGGEVAALRYNNWKITYLRQDAKGMDVWVMPFTKLRAPMITNLKMDPFERACDETNGYNHWYNARMYVLSPSIAFVANWMESFKQFPPRMKPGTFGLEQVMESATGGKK
jgi:arylsulfatase